MRPVSLFLAAVLSAAVLTVAPTAQATTATPTTTTTTSTTTTQAPTPTAAEKRAKKLKAKKLKAKKKRLAEKRRAAARADKIVRRAAKYKGTPYVWGGSTPSGFDCSGYTKYVYKKAIGKSLPRLAGDQMKKGKSVSKSKKKKGDLIGFYSGSYVYHVAIYAGHGNIWHAPRPGRSVEKVKLWTSAYKVRRL